MQFLRSFFAFFLLLNIPVLPAAPHLSNISFDSLAFVIDTSKIENLKSVDKFLESRQTPEDWQVNYLLGKLNARQKKWGDAIKWYKKHLELHQEILLAHYSLAIAYREQGIPRDPFSRKRIWNNSKNHFETVIAADSAYNQVLLEYAWLKRYQNKFADAIDLCQAQLRINPTPQALLDIFRFYDVFLAFGGVYSINPFKGGDDFVQNWLGQRNSPYDIFFLGEQARRIQNFTTADSIYQFILRENLNMPKSPVYLARVRLLYEAGRDATAETIYWQAIDSIKSRNDFQPIYEDMLYIFSDADFANQPNTVAECQSFCRKFWTEKNPTPAAPQNIRLSEHYQRLSYAEKNFRFDGFRLFANDPDRTGTLEYPRVFYENRILNDKGLVYLRFGERDDWATTLGENLPHNESWLYLPRGGFPKMIFHFEIARENGGAGCWRLVPLPTSRAMFESRLGWDQAYYTLYATRSEMDFFQTLTNEGEKARKQIRDVMEKEFHTWPKDLQRLPMHFVVNRFRHDKKHFIAEVSIAIPREILLANQTGDFVLEGGTVIYDSLWQIIAKKPERIPISPNSTQFLAEQLIRHYRFELGVPKINGAMHLSQENQHRLDAYKFGLDFSSLATDSLVCSDIEMAYRIAPATAPNSFVKNDLEVIPNPAKQFDRSNPVYVYFEIYNLTQNESGTTFYEIEYTASIDEGQRNLLSKIWGKITGKQPQLISISNQQEGTGSNSIENLALDFSQTNGKRMKLKITVRDLIGNLHATTEIEFELFN